MSKLDKKLVSKLLKAANIIHKKSTRGSSNFMIVNPEIANILNDINEQVEKRKLREKKIKRILYEENIDNVDNDINC
jgi:hypothetical protein